MTDVAVDSIDAPVPCWTYTSLGLAALGHPEIVFLLRRGDEAEAPPQPAYALGAISRAAQQGSIARAGGRTEFGPSPFFVERGWGGWMYVAPHGLAAVPAGAMLAIAVAPDELPVVAAYGATRIAARLGRASSFFPCPPWSVPRPSVAVAGELEQTVLRGVALAGGLDATVTRVGEHVHLRLPAWTAARFAENLAQMSPRAALAITANVADDADACLVWSPGQEGASAITMPGASGERIAGAFVLLVPEQADDRVIVVEDGLAALLRDATWQAMRDALSAGRPFACDGFELSFSS